MSATVQSFKPVQTTKGRSPGARTSTGHRGTDVVTGFNTQYEALNWIGDKSANWAAEEIPKDSA